ncbi:knob-associated histidine-rich protein-like [Limulus polyphemus]|uniref:Knob-associated histidine-rich protein-like n=1 Tax=Limulus polyphemus TaxID=6850 RepID=A0ABM1BGG1_LIMPO|nr:knob-associated histidine-rich protein-like [Limulus polyphemus]
MDRASKEKSETSNDMENKIYKTKGSSHKSLQSTKNIGSKSSQKSASSSLKFKKGERKQKHNISREESETSNDTEIEICKTEKSSHKSNQSTKNLGSKLSQKSTFSSLKSKKGEKKQKHSTSREESETSNDTENEICNIEKSSHKSIQSTKNLGSKSSQKSTFSSLKSKKEEKKQKHNTSREESETSNDTENEIGKIEGSSHKSTKNLGSKSSQKSAFSSLKSIKGERKQKHSTSREESKTSIEMETEICKTEGSSHKSLQSTKHPVLESPQKFAFSSLKSKETEQEQQEFISKEETKTFCKTESLKSSEHTARYEDKEPNKQLLSSRDDYRWEDFPGFTPLQCQAFKAWFDRQVVS